jgi:hypothetical protein
MSTPFSGGCACGAIRYECTAEPAISLNCHCRDCQRASGSAFAPIRRVPTDTLKIIGTPKWYEGTGGSGAKVRRGFCPECGSYLFALTLFQPERISVTAASLDEPSAFRPDADCYTASAQPWDYMNPELPKYPRMPS